MAYTNARIPVQISFLTFRDDSLPLTSVVEYKKESERRAAPAVVPAAADNTFALTTGSFPQELILTTRSSFANIKRIELTLDEAKVILVERCTASSGNASSGRSSPQSPAGRTTSSSTTVGADPMSADYEVIAERTLSRGEEVSSAKTEAGLDDDLKPRKPQVEVLELDPLGAGKGIRAIKLKILSGYSDFVGILGVELYGEESEQRIAVLESKAEVNM